VRLSGCNQRPDLPGDAEKRRIDNDADGNRDGHSYEQARVVVNVKLSRNMSFHRGLRCFVDYIGPENHRNTETASTLNYLSDS
jgi:hypothetical protein